jgi:two-component system, chemotaxis family, protein-glutamate methylesterase/glutaminase
MAKTAKIRVLIIDDSLFMRQLISEILTSQSDIEVIDTASNGHDGLLKIEKLNPDVVTLDHEMPGLTGVETLKKIMRHNPVAVIMISAHTLNGGKITLEALASGAIDYVLKPSGALSLDIKNSSHEIIEKVRIAASIDIKTVKDFLKKKPAKLSLPKVELAVTSIIAIGSSTGGAKGLEIILGSLPVGFPYSVLIVQHMPEMFTSLLADRLDRLGKIKVKEAENSEVVKGGVAYVAPGGWHMKVKLGSKNKDWDLKSGAKNLDPKKQILSPEIELTKEPVVNGMRPSVDTLMHSVAAVYGAESIGVIISGMGSDGAEGLGSILHAGGQTIAQDEETSVVFGMPRRAIEAGVVADVLPIDKIAPKIIELIAVSKKL